MPSAEAELRELVARVSRAVAARTGKGRDELAGVVAAEVAAALEASDAATGKDAATATAAAAVAAAKVCPGCLDQERRKSGRRAVVTTTGKNQRGIVAKIAQAIADAGGDILDISQTLVADYFSMIIIVDMAGLAVPFAEFKARLTRAVQSLGAECLVMHEEVVAALQRV
ncbi:MAG TPA: ACT domain-containing protein [Polyangia bacterium]|nr:ACT domain-containing protein [Polyangia bacterium]